MPRRRRSVPNPSRRTRPLSFADVARLRGCSRSTVTRAVRAGGALSAALLDGGRIDVGHPAARRWIGPAVAAELGGAEPPSEAGVVTPAEFAELHGLPADQVHADMSGPLAPAVVPPEHVSPSTFAQLASEPEEAVVAAGLGGVLAPAVTLSGWIDLEHDAALRFLAARPFVGEPPDVDGAGYLAPACVGARIDVAHPVARAFLARCLGRIPTEADLGGPLSARAADRQGASAQ